MRIPRNIIPPQIVSKNFRRMIGKLLHPAPVKRGCEVVVREPAPEEETLAGEVGLLVDEPELPGVLVVLDDPAIPP